MSLSESTLYSWLSVKELLAGNRRDICGLIDCNGAWTHSHLVRKRTRSHRLNGWAYKLSGCGLESRYSHLNSDCSNLIISLSLCQIWLPSCKKCLYSEFFWSVFSRIWTEYGGLHNKSPYSVRMPVNKDQKNSEYKHVAVCFLSNSLKNKSY